MISENRQVLHATTFYGYWQRFVELLATEWNK
jgi:hypothetical protein